jgi:hypothetical protein
MNDVFFVQRNLVHFINFNTIRMYHVSFFFFFFLYKKKETLYLKRKETQQTYSIEDRSTLHA